ncbi:MAG: helix-turn-helix domain-containing protein [Candidatus Omnitrophica bacterium]|nr:helix-turn-helix domain-containing protein [Candidatus Omnitrophota bacterium]
MSNLLTPENICQRYGVSIWTVYQWTSKSLIPHLKIRGMVRFREEDIEKWESKGAVQVNLL